MSFKLAALVLMFAFVGQGFSLPRTEPQPYQNGLVDFALMSLTRESELTVVEGLKNCLSTGVQILSRYKEKVILSLKGVSLRLALIGSATKCFVQKSAAQVHNCGLQSFGKYKTESDAIVMKKNQNQLELDHLLKKFPGCLKEATPPLPTPKPLH